jgi:UDP-N-acetylmuramoyl-L-alanyl-D-glutamate--2,6-diaminopimelate ligase
MIKLLMPPLKRLYHFSWALLSILVYGRPSKQIKVIGVTGTDGKTTTSTLIQAGLKEAGLKVAMLNGLEFSLPSKEWKNKSDNSTPGRLVIRKFLRQAVKENCDVVILEVTSWGLEQYRVFGVAFDIAVITNFAHEHLDLHGSMQRYRQMKGKLFKALKSSKKPGQPKIAVINKDDESYSFFARFKTDQIFSYGVKNKADFTASAIEQRPELSFEVFHKGTKYHADLQMKGSFNVSNVLASIAACHGVGVDEQTALAGMAKVTQVPGRMEFIDLGQPFHVVVDFAHTAQAFEAIFDSARKMVGRTNKVIAVYGSAGGRDPGRRQMIGELAGRMIDYSVLTTDDPRKEDPKKIADEIISALKERGKREDDDYEFVKDRGEAIKRGVELATEGDIVLTLSMGDYEVMYVGSGKVKWSDRDAAKSALQNLGFSKS